MKRITILLAALLAAAVPTEARKAKKFVHETVEIPSVEPQVIAVETENTQLLLGVLGNRQVVIRHYGQPVANPSQFLEFNGVAAEAYPAAGGTFLGEPALHVKYADGTHNTELR